MSSDYETTRQPGGRFGAGNPGRQPGARNRASHGAIMAILEDFHRHRHDVLEKMRVHYTPEYLTTLARLMPVFAETQIEGPDALSDADAKRLLREARSVIANHKNPRDALRDIERLLENGPTPNAASTANLR